MDEKSRNRGLELNLTACAGPEVRVDPAGQIVTAELCEHMEGPASPRCSKRKVIQRVADQDARQAQSLRNGRPGIARGDSAPPRYARPSPASGAQSTPVDRVGRSS